MKFYGNWQVAIFDFDGTIFDLEIDWKELKTQLNKKYGSKTLDWTSKPLLECLDQLSPEVRSKALAVIDEFELRGVSGGKFMSGAREIIQAIKEKGKRFAIVSRNGRKAILAAFKLHKLPTPDMVVGRDDVLKQKPHPESVQLVFNKFKLALDSCFIVGDTYHDMEVGKQLGIYRILVRSPKLKESPTHLADVTIDSLAELLHTLSSLAL